MTAVRIDWQETRLGEIADFRNGVNYTKENFGRGVKVINVKDFQDYTTPKYDSLDEINPDGAVRAAHLLQENDVIFVRSNGNRELIGRSLALLAVPPEPITHSAFTIRVRLHSRPELSPRFYAYVFRSDAIRQILSAQGNGANISNLNQDILERLVVPLPPRPQQDRIAAILSAYDDLIENHTRRIAILEEMARRLYEEWFVHFRFPGHEEAEFVSSELGDTPNGWPVVRLDELVQINPRTSVPAEGLKPFVPMGALSETNMVIGPVEERDGNSGTKFRNNDTLVARITPCLENGKTGFVDFMTEDHPVGFGSTEFIVLRPAVLGRCSIYCLARSHAFRDVAIKSMSGSEGRQRVQPDSVKSFLVARPPTALLDRFEDFAWPCFRQVSALAKKNANLRAQRDMLLPRLISGEIDVTQTLEAAKEAAE